MNRFKKPLCCQIEEMEPLSFLILCCLILLVKIKESLLLPVPKELASNEITLDASFISRTEAQPLWVMMSVKLGIIWI